MNISKKKKKKKYLIYKWKFVGEKSYSIEEDEESIKTEIYNNGPVEGAFSVYEDFVSYKSGTYRNNFKLNNQKSPLPSSVSSVLSLYLWIKMTSQNN